MVGQPLQALHDFALKLDPQAFVKVSRGGAEVKFDWNRPAHIPRGGSEIIPSGYLAEKLNQPGDRSEIAATVINRCMHAGWTPEQVFQAMVEHGGSVVERYTENGKDFETALRADIQRLWSKPNPNSIEVRFSEWLKANPTATPQEIAAQASVIAQADPFGAPVRRHRFKGYTPMEGAALPDLAYFDTTKLLPRVPGGAHGTLAGGKASYKTGVAMKLSLDAIFADETVRVLYVAGEGGYGIAKIRLAAALKARGKTLADVEGRWITVPKSPNLLNSADIAEIIEEHKDFDPNLVWIDTITRATAGTDISAPQTGSGVTEGAIALAEGFNDALVMLIGHPPHGGAERLLGSVLIPDHAFVNLYNKYDKTTGIIDLHLVNMKEGPDDFSVFFKRELIDGVPVVMDTDEKPQPKGRELPKAEAEKWQFRTQVGRAIQEHAAEKDDVRLTTAALALWMTRSEPADMRDNALDSLQRRLQRHIENNALRDLVVCAQATGQPLSRPYTFKTWHEIADIFSSTKW